MGRSRRKPPRGWHFWRKAFWTRPALLVGYALPVGMLGAVLLLGVPGAVGDAVAMQPGVECPRTAVRPVADVDAPQGCLERIAVTLSGPWYSRGPGSDWLLEVDRDGRRTSYVEADAPTEGSRRLKRLGDDARVDALLWEGSPVLIDLGAGSRVETAEWGHRGWLFQLCLGLFTLSGCPMLLQAARMKRRTTDGWWSIRGEPVGLLEMSPLMQVACLLAAPALTAFLPLAFGLHTALAVSAGLFGLALAIFAVVKARRSARRTKGHGSRGHLTSRGPR
jgi:hypothetical protein